MKLLYFEYLIWKGRIDIQKISLEFGLFVTVKSLNIQTIK